MAMNMFQTTGRPNARKVIVKFSSSHSSLLTCFTLCTRFTHFTLISLFSFQSSHSSLYFLFFTRALWEGLVWVLEVVGGFFLLFLLFFLINPLLDPNGWI